MSRIYKVTTPAGERLVEATTKSQAIRHCVSADYEAVAISASDLYNLIQRNVKVESAAGEAVQSELLRASNEAVRCERTAELLPPPAASQPIAPPPAKVAIAPLVNPVLAEQMRINPQAAQAASVPQLDALPPAAPVNWAAREQRG